MYTQANTQANTQSRYSKQILKANTLAGKLPLSPGEIAPCAPGDPLVPSVKTQKNKTSKVILYSYWGNNNIACTMCEPHIAVEYFSQNEWVFVCSLILVLKGFLLFTCYSILESCSYEL